MPKKVNLGKFLPNYFAMSQTVTIFVALKSCLILNRAWTWTQIGRMIYFSQVGQEIDLNLLCDRVL